MLCVKCPEDGKLPGNEGSREILPRCNIASATALSELVSLRCGENYYTAS